MGRDEEGVEELERALADELKSSDIWAAMIGALLAEVTYATGDGSSAEVLDHTRRSLGSMPSYVFEPEILRVEAEWLRLHDREDEARGACSGRSPSLASKGRGPGASLWARARTFGTHATLI